MFIFGTRPEFIKVFPIIKKVEESATLHPILVNTGQHREMLDNLLTEFAIKPDYDLKIMEKSNGLTDILTNSLQGINPIIEKEQPDLILVHGDTSATLAGSIQALYHQTPLGHIEAGLRTYNKYSPFPEEMNRQITGVIADLNFTPTTKTREYLLSEGKDPNSIFVVGNSAIDTLQYTVTENYNHPILEWAGDKKIVLITAHRRENIEQMAEMFRTLNKLALEYIDYRFVYPVHLNPLIQTLTKQHLTAENVRLIPPLETVDFHNIMSHSYLILTDSGGIQEEAPSLGKPVLVLRDTTERPEGVEAGTLKLIGTSSDAIIANTRLLLDNEVEYKKMAGTKNPYGNGDTAEQIVKIIEKYFQL